MSVTDLARQQMGQVATRDYENPFSSGGGSSLINAGSGRVTDTQIAAKELGDIQARVLLAKKYSRDPAIAYDRIMTACQRVGLASVAIYTYARGGTNINGPSIRLAEEIVRDWGNIDCGWVELERREYESTVRAYAWDIETNAYKQIIFVVPHFRSKKQNGREIQVPLTNERDLYELLANNAARRMRNCILALVPGDIVEAAVEQCHRTLVTKCEITPERIKKMVAAFEPLGVTKSQIETRIQRKLEAIQPAQFVRLTEIYNSLKDGMSEPGDWFETESAEDLSPVPSAADTLKSVLKANSSTLAKNTRGKAKAPQNTPESAETDINRGSAPSKAEYDLPFDQDPAETESGGGNAEESLYDRLAAKIARTKTPAGLKSIFDSVLHAVDTGEITPEQSTTLLDLLDAQGKQEEGKA